MRAQMDESIHEAMNIRFQFKELFSFWVIFCHLNMVYTWKFISSIV